MSQKLVLSVDIDGDEYDLLRFLQKLSDVMNSAAVDPWGSEYSRSFSVLSDEVDRVLFDVGNACSVAKGH